MEHFNKFQYFMAIASNEKRNKLCRVFAVWTSKNEIEESERKESWWKGSKKINLFAMLVM